MGMPIIIHGYNTLDNLIGFNIYRDGTQLNTYPIEALSYTDADSTVILPETEYCYTVSAIYNGCISKISDSLVIL